MNAPRQLSDNELQNLLGRAIEDHQNGALDEARTGYLRLVEYYPNAPVLHYNLGLVFYDQGRYREAVAAFSKATSLNPGDMDMLFNLALSVKKLGDLSGAIALLKEILSIDPESLDTLYTLAGCYRELKQYPQSRDTYRELLRLDPDNLAANNNLAYIHHLTGAREEAIYYYDRVLEINPGHVSAKHMLAALCGSGATSSPDSYVAEVFDNYSDKYEHSLVAELEYCVPTALRNLLDSCPQAKKRYNYGLDLGCGTGLSGKAFFDLAEILAGIDLSEKMLAVAAEKNIYHHLHVGSIASFLESVNERFDFYLAADVFAYVGDLARTFILLKKCAEPHAVFCFSTERYDDSGFCLRESGRFAHSPDYIYDISENTGWEVVSRESRGLRKESGAWVEGDLWVLLARIE